MATDAPVDPLVVRLDDLQERAVEAFGGVLERVFADDPAANPALVVEVVEVSPVEGIPTLVLVAPWTINGLIFPPDDGPAELVVAGITRRVFRGDVPPLGVYWSVNLVPDVSRLTSPRQARTLAGSFAGPFREAVRNWSAAAR